MQLRSTTDYAIRLVLYLAGQDRGHGVTGSEIAQHTGIAAGYVRKVAAELRMAGLVESGQGTGGGFRLTRAPEDITLFDVILAGECTVKINRCLEDPALCSRGAAPYCKVHLKLDMLQALLERYLRDIKISDLL